jgi:hypothetical protein
MAKQTCDTCYNFVLERGLLPRYKCLEHDPEVGQNKTREMDTNGIGCTAWQPKPQPWRQNYRR